MRVNLEQTIYGIRFQNPTVLAAGVLGITASSCRRVARSGAGAVTFKSVWLQEHPGHMNPTILGTGHGNLVAVGLSDGGMEKAHQEMRAYMQDKPAPIIASIVASGVQMFADTAAAIAEVKPDLIEVNISCPNLESELGRPFACDVADSAAVTKAVKAAVKDIPIFLKLSPNTPDIGDVAAACAAEGADGFTAVNLYGPGMAIDIGSRHTILTNRVGGLGGPVIHPIAVRCVAEVFKATNGKLPIIGLGGVRSGEDALELIMAGASLVGIGSAIAERGVDVFAQVAQEMNDWGDAQGVSDIRELIGAIHHSPARA